MRKAGKSLADTGHQFKLSKFTVMLWVKWSEALRSDAFPLHLSPLGWLIRPRGPVTVFEERSNGKPFNLSLDIEGET